MTPTPIDAAFVPPAIRKAGPEARRLYEAALGFERLLVRELTESLAESAEAEGEDHGDAATALYREMLPDALADSLGATGGIGLAESLYRSMRGPEAA